MATTRFQIMVPLPISIPRGNKNLTGRGSQRQDRRLCLLAMFAAGYISHKVSLYLTATNLQFSISILILCILYHKSRQKRQVVVMWLFALRTFYLMNIFSFLKATMRNHLMPPPQALKFLQNFLFLFVIRNFFFSLVFGSGFAKLLVI